MRVKLAELYGGLVETDKWAFQRVRWDGFKHFQKINPRVKDLNHRDVPSNFPDAVRALQSMGQDETSRLFWTDGTQLYSGDREGKKDYQAWDPGSKSWVRS